MRKVNIALFTLAVCSCHNHRQGDTPLALPAVSVPTSTPLTNESSRVALGDPADAAHRRILKAGGSVITGIGALYLGPGELQYYELKDKTCAILRYESAEGQEAKVTRILLGEPGRGYGDKLQWSKQQQREVEFVELQ